MSLALWAEINNLWKEIARLNEQLLKLQIAVDEAKSEKPKGRKGA